MCANIMASSDKNTCRGMQVERVGCVPYSGTLLPPSRPDLSGQVSRPCFPVAPDWLHRDIVSAPDILERGHPMVARTIVLSPQPHNR